MNREVNKIQEPQKLNSSKHEKIGPRRGQDLSPRGACGFFLVCGFFCGSLVPQLMKLGKSAAITTMKSTPIIQKRMVVPQAAPLLTF